MLTADDVTRYFIVKSKLSSADITALCIDNEEEFCKLQFLYYNPITLEYTFDTIDVILNVYTEVYIKDEMRPSVILKNVCNEHLSSNVKPFVFRTIEDVEEIMKELGFNDDDYCVFDEEITYLLRTFWNVKIKSNFSVLLIHNNTFEVKPNDEICGRISYNRFLAIKDIERYFWYYNIHKLDNNMESSDAIHGNTEEELEYSYFRASVDLLELSDTIYFFNEEGSKTCKLLREISKEFNLHVLNDLIK